MQAIYVGGIGMEKILSTSIFGDWFKEKHDLKLDSKPFDHIVIDNFFNIEFANKCFNESLEFSKKEMWHYDNSFEKQRVMNKWDQFGPNIYLAYSILCSHPVCSLFSELFNEDIIPDIGLHGGGIVMYPNGGKLNVHLDYETHPKLEMVRQLNLLIYINPNWIEKWGGGLSLYEEEKDKELKKVQEISCIFNRAILFNTDQNSWHGLPEKIVCPKDQARTAFNLYYLNPKKVGKYNRYRAEFVGTREQKLNDPDIEKKSKARMDKTAPVYD